MRRSLGTSRVRIIVTCTNRKRVPVASSMRLREVDAADIQTRAKRWIEALRTSSQSVHLPAQIYSGDHWYVATTLPDTARARGLDADLWICSAGYGLIGEDAPIKAYSATFTREN